HLRQRQSRDAAHEGHAGHDGRRRLCARAGPSDRAGAAVSRQRRAASGRTVGHHRRRHPLLRCAMVIFDLETVAIDRATDLVEPVSAPSNYKDEAKIASYVAEKQAEQISKAALYPWTARVVAIGWYDTNADRPRATVQVCRTEQDEKHTLMDFWSMASRDDGRFLIPLCGFNSLSFDLPMLVARSMLLGVKHPMPSLDRYRSPHPDLMQILSFKGAIPSRSLKWYAKRFGIPCEDTVSGAD